MIRPRYKKRTGTPSEWAGEWGAVLDPYLKKWNQGQHSANARGAGSSQAGKKRTLDHCELVEITVDKDSAQAEETIKGQ